MAFGLNMLKRIKSHYRRQALQRVMMMGKGSCVHEEAEINNLQGKSGREHLKIGANTHIRGELTVYPYGKGIRIGDYSYVGRYSVIRAGNNVSIGNHVLIAHQVTIMDTDSHEIDAEERARSHMLMLKEGHPHSPGYVKTLPVVIHDHVWISCNVCILKGVTIGEGAIVASGSVVTRDVPAWTLVAGNPAKVIKPLKKNENIQICQETEEK